jgi:4-coumarate--CoA ligase
MCPTALALVDTAIGRGLTFAEFCSAIDATVLSSHMGMHRGDVILILAPNCILFKWIFDFFHNLNFFNKMNS